MSPAFARSAARAAIVAGAALLVSAGAAPLAGTASADVTVSPSSAVQGDYTKLSFLVPNESPSAATVKLRVTFPTRPPLSVVRVGRHPGWTADIIRTKVRQPSDVCDCAVTPTVTSITWTADKGAGIDPDEFGEFEVYVGPLPAKPRLDFPAVQTYDDGEVDRWTTKGRPGDRGAQAAPSLTLKPAPATAANDADAAAAPANRARTEPTAAESPAPTTRWLSGAALVLGLGGMAAAGLTAARRRGRSSPQA